jgi:hypothetical protein
MFSNTHAENISAGPFPGTREVKNKCPQVCGEKNLEWNSRWAKTMQRGNMQTLDCICDPKGTQAAAKAAAAAAKEKTTQAAVTPAPEAKTPQVAVELSPEAKAEATSRLLNLLKFDENSDEVLRALGEDRQKVYATVNSKRFAGLNEVVQKLISKGADVNANGGEPLYLAITSQTTDYPGGGTKTRMVFGLLSVVHVLVNNGANVKSYYKGATPLHWAAESANKDIARFLMDKGADKNAKDKDGKIPLNYLYRGYVERPESYPQYQEVVKLLTP